jgi:hypothetical protein
MRPLKDALMKPLKLSSSEKSALKEFLLALSGDPSPITAIRVDLSYKPIEDWYNKKN